MSRTGALALGAVVVGVLDILDAFLFFGMRGVSPIRICQSIAAGLLGRAAFQGGVPTAALGLALHFFIALCVVAVYHLASRRVDLLVRQAVVCGLAYGVGVYLVMNFVVIPLSRAGGGGGRALPVIVNGVLIHMLGVGLPAALSARLARRGPVGQW